MGLRPTRSPGPFTAVYGSPIRKAPASLRLLISAIDIDRSYLFFLTMEVARALRSNMVPSSRLLVLATLRKLWVIFYVVLAVMQMDLIEKHALPGSGKYAIRVCLRLTWEELRWTRSRRYLWRNRGTVRTSVAWLNTAYR